MAITYSVDNAGKKIECICQQKINLQDILDYFMRLLKNNRISHGAVERVRFDKCEKFHFTYDECVIIAKKYFAVKQQKGIKTTEFICRSPLAYGMARMLQMAFEMHGPAHEIVIAENSGELRDVNCADSDAAQESVEKRTRHAEMN